MLRRGSTEQDPTTTSTNMTRVKSLMSSYYKRDEEDESDSSEERHRQRSDVDSAWFEVESHSNALLKSSSYFQLLDVDNELRKDIVQLDSSMQLLVYDNYSKFIGAADTMQNMKEKLIKMESQVSGLESKMDAIANATRKMNARNSEKREEVARLDRLGSLVNKLSTLFELPKKLKAAGNVNEMRTVVTVYKSAQPLLAKHADIPSFAKIQQQSKDGTLDILARLKAKIGLSTEHMSEDEFDAMVSIMLDLNEPSEQLAVMFFRWHRDYIFRTAPSKDDLNLEAFDVCIDNIKTTMFASLSRTLNTGEEYFPESSSSEHVADLKSGLARDVVRAVLDRFRSRFDFEPSAFGLTRTTSMSNIRDRDVAATKSRDEENQGVEHFVSALSLVSKELIDFQNSLASPRVAQALRLGDRAQELSERAMRRQVNAAMAELKTRAEKRLNCLDANDDSSNERLESYRQDMDSVLQGLLNDAGEAKSYLGLLLKRGASIISETSESFEYLFKFQLQDWCVWLGDSLRSPSKEMEGSNSAMSSLLARALVARLLATRVHEFGLLDQKAAVSVLRSASEDALKSFCAYHGVKAASKVAEEISSSAFNGEVGRPSAVGDGVVFMLNHVAGMQRLLKAAGIPAAKSKNAVQAAPSAAVAAASAGGDGYRRGMGGVSGKPDTKLGGGTSLGQNIARLFSEKIIVFDRVDLDTNSIMAAALRVALKTWFEHIRESVLTRFAFQQIQLDAHFVRTAIPFLAVDNAPSVNKLVTEVVASARERCIAPETLDAAIVDNLCNAKRDAVKAR